MLAETVNLIRLPLQVAAGAEVKLLQATAQAEVVVVVVVPAATAVVMAAEPALPDKEIVAVQTCMLVQIMVVVVVVEQVPLETVAKLS
jgi:hypothetical protein